MSPRIANKDRAEIPKPKVQVGTLGFLPLNNLAVSYRYQQVGDVLIGMQGQSPLTGNQVQLNTRGQTVPFDLKGVYFKSISDAFYRGKLPQVIVATPSVDELPEFLNDFVDFVDKVLSFGFFLQPDAIDTLMPVVVLATPGVFFSRFTQLLANHLDKLEGLELAWRQQIVSRFVRGFIEDGLESFELWYKRPFELIKPPTKLKIAASREADVALLETIQSVLSLHGLITVVENRVNNNTDRLELEHAIQRAAQVILPNLAESHGLTMKDFKQLVERVSKSILKVGQKLLAFEEMEPVVPVETKLKQDRPNPLSQSDLTITASLSHYAECLDLPEEKALFERLTAQIRKKLSP